MQTLPLALFLVMLELTIGSFVSLYILDLRGDSSRGFIVFQGVLYLVFAGLTLLAMNAFATPQLVHGYGLDDRWLNAQGPLVLLFTALMVPWNVLLWRDRQPRAGARKTARVAATDAAETGGSAVATQTRTAAATSTGMGTPTARRVRFALGGLTSLVGLAAIVDVGMAYRALAASRLDGAFVVLTFVAGAIALGGVMTAMLLGHWYLNTPTASGKPLEFAALLMLGALVAEIVFSLAIGPSTAHPSLTPTSVAPGTTIQATDHGLKVSTPSATAQSQGQQPSQARQTPIDTGGMVWAQLLIGFAAPLVLGAVALYLTRGRSFQSATGMLYLCVAFLFFGEILGRGLLLFPIF